VEREEKEEEEVQEALFVAVAVVGMRKMMTLLTVLIVIVNVYSNMRIARLINQFLVLIVDIQSLVLNRMDVHGKWPAATAMQKNVLFNLDNEQQADPCGQAF